MLLSIELKDLTIHPLNVRKDSSKAAIDQLSANIAEIGLINPLRVCAGERKGKYLVIAGGQRLRALKHLAMINAKEDPKPVECLLTTDNELAVSLSENLVRSPLSPVEEFRAFGAMAKIHSNEEIGELFHVKQFRVQQRLALGKLAPSILKSLEKKELTLETAEALTLITDHKRQRELYSQFSSHNNPGHMIKASLQDSTFRSSFAAFDLDLYKGEYITDLFSFGLDDEASERYLADFAEAIRLQAIAGQERSDAFVDDGWKWSEFRPEEIEWAEYEKHDREHKSWTGKYANEWSPTAKKKTGVFVSFNYRNELEIREGFYTLEETKSRRAKKKTTDSPQEEEVEIETGSGASYSNALKADLNSMASVALNRAMVVRPEIAIRMLLAQMMAVFETGFHEKIMDVMLSTPSPGELASQLSEHAVTIGSTKRLDDLDDIFKLIGKGYKAAEFDDRLKKFTQGEIVEALACVVSRAICLQPGEKFFSIKDELVFNWRDGWTPDLTFFERLTKPQCAFILNEVGFEKEAIDVVMTGKRSEVHSLLNRLFLEPAIKVAEYHPHMKNPNCVVIVQAINAWIPSEIRAPEKG